MKDRMMILMTMAKGARMAKMITMVIQMTMAMRRGWRRWSQWWYRWPWRRGEDGEDDEEGDEGEDDSSDEDSDESSNSNDSEDRDMRDDSIPRDKAHLCPVSGCQEWITSQQQRFGHERREDTNRQSPLLSHLGAPGMDHITTENNSKQNRRRIEGVSGLPNNYIAICGGWRGVAQIIRWHRPSTQQIQRQIRSCILSLCFLTSIKGSEKFGVGCHKVGASLTPNPLPRVKL